MRESATGVSLAELGVLACGLACGIAVDAAQTIYARARLSSRRIATELLDELDRRETQRVADRLEASETARAAQERIQQLERAAAEQDAVIEGGGDAVIGLRQRIVDLEATVTRLDQELEAAIKKEILAGSSEAGRRLRSLEDLARGVVEGWAMFAGKLPNLYRDVDDKVVLVTDVARMDDAITALGRAMPSDAPGARGAQAGG